MLTILIISHLLGDYILQFDVIARWKTRSIWGVLAHGCIVTLTTLACVWVVAPSWWLNALMIGLLHTLIDIVRARLVHTQNTQAELLWFLADQAAHAATLLGAVAWSGAPTLAVLQMHVAPWLSPFVTKTFLIPVIAALLILQPTWVVLRFLVRGLYGSEAAPQLGLGEKYEPMLERFLIATCTFFGLFYLIPLIMLPRRLTKFQAQDNTLGVMLCMTSHWVETLLGVSMSIVAGLVARAVIGLF